MKRRTPRFTAATASVLVAAWLLGGSVLAGAEALTKAIEVRSLSVAEAQKGLTAKLRGTVIFIEPTAIFLQDETSSAFFRPDNIDVLRPGDEIEVEGITRMGLYLPGLGESSYRILRSGKLPPGIPANYDDLVSARYHYQRVAVEGVVRSVTATDEGRSLVRLAMGSRVIDVRVEMPPERDRSLVDCRVQIRGLAAGYHNERRQLVQAHVRSSDWNEITILEAAPALAQVPLISAAELLAFHLTGRGERRVRIQGVVTAEFPGGHVFLRQAETAFGVRLNTVTALNLGDRVEIIGFPEMDRFSASVVNAELVSQDAGSPLAPIDVGTLDRLTGLHDGQLVTVTAALADAFKTEDGNKLVLQGPNLVVQARLPSTATTIPEVGSRVRVTGICLVETTRPGSGFASRPGVVSLRLRSAEDLVVVESPPWWTVRRLGAILAALAAVTLVAGLWIAILRRQVSRQTAALRHRIEAEAALEERQRIAREFHDTLEQELAGVSLRLDALATRVADDKGKGLIAASRNLVSRIQTETRDLISDLRDPAETAGDLTAALTALASRTNNERGAEVCLEVAGSIPTLSATIVHDLRMIARESLNNALNHGRATEVVLRLTADAMCLTLQIIDRGCGFDVTDATLGKRGHFGCAGIRERGRKIGTTVIWRSAPQAGTIVEVVLPLPSSLRKHQQTVLAAPTRPTASTSGYEEKPAII